MGCRRGSRPGRRTAIEAPWPLRVVRRFAYGTLALVLVANVVLYVAVAVYESRAGVVVAELEPSTSDAQAESLIWNVVMEQSGVESVTQNDPLVLEIELVEDATEAERVELLEALRSSPEVERIEADQ
jgi:hypothetical protein